MSFDRLHKVIFFYINLALVLLMLNSCAIAPPVQEMSNARQSLKAASDANADKLASSLYEEAKMRLQSATHELDVGEYERARILALEAKQLALKARQLAISKKSE